VSASNLCCSILQGAAAASAAANAQDDGGDEGTCSQHDSSAAKDSSSSSGGHETLFFAGSLYHTYKGEIISLARGRPGSASPGRYNPLVGRLCNLARVRGVFSKLLCWGNGLRSSVCWAAALHVGRLRVCLHVGVGVIGRHAWVVARPLAESPAILPLAVCLLLCSQTHTWTEPPSDAGVYEKWQRDGETAVKTLSGRRPLRAGPRERRDTSASRSASAETVAGLMRQHSSFSSSSGPTDDGQPASAGGRRHVLAMNTW
jgi:hypothetical protein